MVSPALPILPAQWGEILANVQRALSEAEQVAAHSAQQLDTLPTPPITLPAWQAQLEQLAASGRRLHAGVAAADLAGAEVDAALQAAEAALRQWSDQAAAAARKLANDAGPSV